MIFDKGVKTIQWRKDSIFKKWFWGNGISACKIIKVDSYITPCTQINTKWITDINIRPEMIKTPRRKHKENIYNICANNDFLDLATKGKIDVGLHITKNLHRKETISRVKT